MHAPLLSYGRIPKWKWCCLRGCVQSNGMANSLGSETQSLQRIGTRTGYGHAPLSVLECSGAVLKPFGNVPELLWSHWRHIGDTVFVIGDILVTHWRHFSVIGATYWRHIGDTCFVIGGTLATPDLGRHWRHICDTLFVIGDTLLFSTQLSQLAIGNTLAFGDTLPALLEDDSMTH